ncbi:hypothetical protein J27TS7_46880 [Paenibacillus dendritiformis]|nr:hypothetical protein J27TS7_46880 [Paenibacillus dendritiformis]
MEQRHALDQVEALALKKKAAWDSGKFQYLLRSILCNWLVCMAFFIPMSLKGDGPKLFDHGAAARHLPRCII